MTQRGRAGARPGSAGRRTADPRRDPAAGAPTPAPRVDVAAARTRVRAVIEPVLTAEGYDLEDLTITRAGRRHVVRVMVDTDGGVDLDTVATVSREISRALDAAEEADGEVLVGEYQLEVGSPGVDRPLTLPRHWRRNVGRLVTVPVDGRTLTGRVTSADDDGAADGGVVLDVDGVPRSAAFAALGPGRVQIEFNRVDEVELDDADDDPDGDDSDDDPDGDPDDDDDDDFDDEDGEGEER